MGPPWNRSCLDISVLGNMFNKSLHEVSICLYTYSLMLCQYWAHIAHFMHGPQCTLPRLAIIISPHFIDFGEGRIDAQRLNDKIAQQVNGTAGNRTEISCSSVLSPGPCCFPFEMNLLLQKLRRKCRKNNKISITCANIV